MKRPPVIPLLGIVMAACCLLSTGAKADSTTDTLAVAPAAIPDATYEDRRFPRLRGAYRALWRWQRQARTRPAEEVLATMRAQLAEKPTAAMALAAQVCAQDAFSTTPLTATQSEAIHDWAVNSLSAAPVPWGAQPLWSSEVHGAGVPLSGVYDHLLDQLGEDGVPGNAFAACELYLVALQEIPGDAFPILLDRLERARREGTMLSQEGALLANLALLYIAEDGATFRERRWTWQALASGRHADAYRGNPEVSFTDRKRVMRAAQPWVFRWNAWRAGWECESVAWGNRRMLRRLHESMIPTQTDLLMDVLESDDSSKIDREWAAILWFVREPDTFASHPRAVGEAAARCSLQSYPYAVLMGCEELGWELGEAEVEDALRYSFDTPLTELQGITDRAFEDWRPLVARRLREALHREVEPDRQLEVARALLWCGDKGDHPTIAEALVSNFEDDDVWDNAARARWLLESVGEEAADPLRAGWHVGVEVKDWQLASRCAELLGFLDPEFSPASDENGMRLMARQFLDDDIEGNAEAARWYLSRCGHAAIPILEEAETWEDEQAHDYAVALLEEIRGW